VFAGLLGDDREGLLSDRVLRFRRLLRCENDVGLKFGGLVDEFEQPLGKLAIAPDVLGVHGDHGQARGAFLIPGKLWRRPGLGNRVEGLAVAEDVHVEHILILRPALVRVHLTLVQVHGGGGHAVLEAGVRDGHANAVHDHAPSPRSALHAIVVAIGDVWARVRIVRGDEMRVAVEGARGEERLPGAVVAEALGEMLPQEDLRALHAQDLVDLREVEVGADGCADGAEIGGENLKLIAEGQVVVRQGVGLAGLEHHLTLAVEKHRCGVDALPVRLDHRQGKIGVVVRRE